MNRIWDDLENMKPAKGESLHGLMKRAAAHGRAVEQAIDDVRTEFYDDNIPYWFWRIADAAQPVDLVELARKALPENTDDWGSERQIEAEKLFCVEASRRMDPEQQDKWDRYSMKATSAEFIEYALNVLGLTLRPVPPEDQELFGRFVNSRKYVNSIAAATHVTDYPTGPGWVYMGGGYIEDVGPHAKHGCRYSLTLQNWEKVSDDLDDLEPHLFKWEQSEGLLDHPCPKCSDTGREQGVSLGRTVLRCRSCGWEWKAGDAIHGR